MSFRHWLARQIARHLAPEVFRDADRYDRMRREIELDRQWLVHDFPEVGAFAERVLISDRNHWRALDDKPTESRWHWNISQFREQLRRGEARPRPTTAA